MHAFLQRQFCHSSIKMPANNSLDTSYDTIRLYTHSIFLFMKLTLKLYKQRTFICYYKYILRYVKKNNVS